jgi:hypothetical protein
MRALIIGAVVVLAGIALVAVRTPATTEPAVQRAAEPSVVDDVPHSIAAAARPELRPAPEAPAPAPQHAARRDAESLIAAAIARGQWREQDRETLDLLTRELTGAERVEVVRPLVIAVNEQRIQLDAMF